MRRAKRSRYHREDSSETEDEPVSGPRMSPPQINVTQQPAVEPPKQPEGVGAETQEVAGTPSGPALVISLTAQDPNHPPVVPPVAARESPPAQKRVTFQVAPSKPLDRTVETETQIVELPSSCISTYIELAENGVEGAGGDTASSSMHQCGDRGFAAVVVVLAKRLSQLGMKRFAPPEPK
jgi:hypothetical protein